MCFNPAWVHHQQIVVSDSEEYHQHLVNLIKFYFYNYSNLNFINMIR